jgi:hypothetical protein
MSEPQLRNALFRLGEPLPPEGSPNEVSNGERSAYQRFVEHETTCRAEQAPAGCG